MQGPLAALRAHEAALQRITATDAFGAAVVNRRAFERLVRDLASAEQEIEAEQELTEAEATESWLREWVPTKAQARATFDALIILAALTWTAASAAGVPIPAPTAEAVAGLLALAEIIMRRTL